jgi:hypothetical protein
MKEDEEMLKKHEQEKIVVNNSQAIDLLLGNDIKPAKKETEMTKSDF